MRTWSDVSNSRQPCRHSGSVSMSSKKAFNLLLPVLKRWRVVLMGLSWWWSHSTIPSLLLNVTLGFPHCFELLRVASDYFFLYRAVISLGVSRLQIRFWRGISPSLLASLSAASLPVIPTRLGIQGSYVWVPDLWLGNARYAGESLESDVWSGLVQLMHFCEQIVVWSWDSPHFLVQWFLVCPIL